jgi:hypothetical protein
MWFIAPFLASNMERRRQGKEKEKKEEGVFPLHFFVR